MIEEHLGMPINVFAYPYGAYNSSLATMAKEAGYIAARSAQKGIARTTDDLYTLKAITVTGNFADSNISLQPEVRISRSNQSRRGQGHRPVLQ
ncbi:MAG: polysaccharide deacetylase family protein [Patescibacteria group bacterium]